MDSPRKLNMRPDRRIAVVALSGGMDSTGLLLRIRSNGYTVYANSFNYGQKHVVEIEKAAHTCQMLDKLAHNDNGELKEGAPRVYHRVFDLRPVMSMLFSALTDPGQEVPEGYYEEENMIATVVPNRNAIFASILFAHALNLVKEKDSLVMVGLGVHSGDHAIYPDCRPEFYVSLQRAFQLGNWDSENIVWNLPYLRGTKETILSDALDSCEKLGIDFDEVFASTNTSYNPDPKGRASGKSGADIERILAFHAIGRKDPVEYVDGWEGALADALKVQEDFRSKQG